MNRILRSALLGGINVYRNLISPLTPPACRFYPTCSQYAAEAISEHGAYLGMWLSVKRLAKCGPWHPGGVDLVPERSSAKTLSDARPADAKNKCSPSGCGESYQTHLHH